MWSAKATSSPKCRDSRCPPPISSRRPLTGCAAGRPRASTSSARAATGRHCRDTDSSRCHRSAWGTGSPTRPTYNPLVHEHETFMRRALDLARRGRFTVSPNPMVGCVIVRDGEVIAEGWHQRAGEPHAEIEALHRCENPEGATLVVTLEPCAHHGRTPPCTEAII